MGEVRRLECQRGPKREEYEKDFEILHLQFVVRNLDWGEMQGVYDPYRTSTSVIDPYLDSKG